MRGWISWSLDRSSSYFFPSWVKSSHNPLECLRLAECFSLLLSVSVLWSTALSQLNIPVPGLRLLTYTKQVSCHCASLCTLQWAYIAATKFLPHKRCVFCCTFPIRCPFLRRWPWRIWRPISQHWMLLNKEKQLVFWPWNEQQEEACGCHLCGRLVKRNHCSKITVHFIVTNDSDIPSTKIITFAYKIPPK